MAWNPQVHPSSEGSLSVESISDETPMDRPPSRGPTMMRPIGVCVAIIGFPKKALHDGEGNE